MAASPVYLISYPRSGSTLCRSYLAALQGRPQLSTYLGDLVPAPGPPLMPGLERLRVVKSHHFSEFYKRVVYLVRDGRNAMISHLYLQFLHGGHDRSRPQEILDGLRELDAQGHFWGDHVARAREHAAAGADVRFVRYEDLVSRPLGVLREILSFASAEVSEQALARCVELASSSNAYARDWASGYRHRPEPGSAWDLLHRHRQGSYWREILDGPARRWIHERGATPHLIDLGYAPSEDWWRE